MGAKEAEHHQNIQQDVYENDQSSNDIFEMKFTDLPCKNASSLRNCTVIFEFLIDPQNSIFRIEIN